MFTQFGEKPKTIFLKGIENHKLHQEFEVGTGATVKVGQPVVLNTDGTVKAATANNKNYEIIGYSIHNGKAGSFVTIGMKAFTIVYASPSAACDAGPVKYLGMNSGVEDGIYNDVEALDSTAQDFDPTELVGWALDQSTTGDDIIRLALV